ncbi:hypothetical protein BsWGS_17184 [Bradybaena similaris]
MSDEEDHEYEADVTDEHLTDVVLLDGTIMTDYKILLFNKVSEEKARIWANENQRGPPELHELVLVIMGPHGEQRVMDDELKIEDYLHDLAAGKIRFVRRQ